MYVSCLYDPYKKGINYELLANAIYLITNIPLILYADDIYYNVLKGYSSENVRLIHKPLEELATYNIINNNRDILALPSIRTEEKDTLDYMILINCKVEFLYLASKLCDDKNLAWIDSGLIKVFKNVDKSMEILNRDLNSYNIEKIIIPGCYNNKYETSKLLSSVYWVFCGGYLVCNRNYIERFYHQSLSSIARFMIYETMVWEVNIWAYIYYKYNEIEWYYSDHDDGMVKIPDKYLSSH